MRYLESLHVPAVPHPPFRLRPWAAVLAIAWVAVSWWGLAGVSPQFRVLEIAAVLGAALAGAFVPWFRDASVRGSSLVFAAVLLLHVLSLAFRAGGAAPAGLRRGQSPGQDVGPNENATVRVYPAAGRDTLGPRPG